MFRIKQCNNSISLICEKKQIIENKRKRNFLSAFFKFYQLSSINTIGSCSVISNYLKQSQIVCSNAILGL